MGPELNSKTFGRRLLYVWSVASWISMFMIEYHRVGRRAQQDRSQVWLRYLFDRSDETDQLWGTFVSGHLDFITVKEEIVESSNGTNIQFERIGFQSQKWLAGLRVEAERYASEGQGSESQESIAAAVVATNDCLDYAKMGIEEDPRSQELVGNEGPSFRQLAAAETTVKGEAIDQPACFDRGKPKNGAVDGSPQPSITYRCGVGTMVNRENPMVGECRTRTGRMKFEASGETLYLECAHFNAALVNVVARVIKNLATGESAEAEQSGKSIHWIEARQGAAIETKQLPCSSIRSTLGTIFALTRKVYQKKSSRVDYIERLLAPGTSEYTAASLAHFIAPGSVMNSQVATTLNRGDVAENAKAHSDESSDTSVTADDIETLGRAALHSTQAPHLRAYGESIEDSEWVADLAGNTTRIDQEQRAHSLGVEFGRLIYRGRALQGRHEAETARERRGRRVPRALENLKTNDMAKVKSFAQQTDRETWEPPPISKERATVLTDWGIYARTSFDALAMAARNQRSSRVTCICARAAPGLRHGATTRFDRAAQRTAAAEYCETALGSILGSRKRTGRHYAATEKCVRTSVSAQRHIEARHTCSLTEQTYWVVIGTKTSTLYSTLVDASRLEGSDKSGAVTEPSVKETAVSVGDFNSAHSETAEKWTDETQENLARAGEIQSRRYRIQGDTCIQSALADRDKRHGFEPCAQTDKLDCIDHESTIHILALKEKQMPYDYYPWSVVRIIDNDSIVLHRSRSQVFGVALLRSSYLITSTLCEGGTSASADEQRPAQLERDVREVREAAALELRRVEDQLRACSSGVFITQVTALGRALGETACTEASQRSRKESVLDQTILSPNSPALARAKGKLILLHEAGLEFSQHRAFGRLRPSSGGRSRRYTPVGVVMLPRREGASVEACMSSLIMRCFDGAFARTRPIIMKMQPHHPTNDSRVSRVWMRLGGRLDDVIWDYASGTHNLFEFGFISLEDVWLREYGVTKYSTAKLAELIVISSQRLITSGHIAQWRFAASIRGDTWSLSHRSLSSPNWIHWQREKSAYKTKWTVAEGYHAQELVADLQWNERTMLKYSMFGTGIETTQFECRMATNATTVVICTSVGNELVLDRHRFRPRFEFAIAAKQDDCTIPELDQLFWIQCGKHAQQLKSSLYAVVFIRKNSTVGELLK